MIETLSPKDRLYLSLYIRDGVSAHSQALDRYHWALLAIPAHGDQATRFHARDYFAEPSQTRWIYEEVHVPARGTPKLLSQTYLGDIINNEQLAEILRDTPIDQKNGWNCVDWVERAVELMSEGGALEGGDLKGLELLESQALRAADKEVARREVAVRALL